jgi:hypothetical protein
VPDVDGTPIFAQYSPDFGRGGTDVAPHAHVAAQNPDHQQKRKVRGDEMDRTTAALFHPQPELWPIGWSSGINRILLFSASEIGKKTVGCGGVSHLHGWDNIFVLFEK